MQTSVRQRAALKGAKAGLGLAIVFAIIGLKFPFIFISFLITEIFSIIGAIYGARYIYSKNKNITWLRILFWSNSVTWLVPPIGFATLSATHIINKANHGKDKLLFDRLRQTCFILCVITTLLFTKYIFKLR